MASIKLTGDTSGEITISAPAVAGTNTITLPAETGSVLTDATTSHIIEVDMWRLQSNKTSDGDLTDWARPNDATFSKIGTGLSVSSGIFAFPRTGVYEIGLQMTGRAAAGDTLRVEIKGSNDAFSSNDDTLTQVAVGDDDVNNTSAYGSALFNCTNTTNLKVKLRAESLDSGSFVQGEASSSVTAVIFKRLGDSQ